MTVDYEVHPKEKIYFAIKLFVSVIMYAVIFYIAAFLFTTDDPRTNAMAPVLAIYVGVIILFIILNMGIFIGYIKGNAVKVSATQFKDIHMIATTQSEKLDLRAVPDVYIMQSGGILNAFATRFFGSNYIVLYSEIVEAAYERDTRMLEFIIGHELGHVKRKHLIKRVLLFPSFIVPFLGKAYSRACEYTCDSIGHALAPEGTRNGLLLLVSGRDLFLKVNTDEYIKQGYTEDGFWKWFAEKVSSHPNMTKRIIKFREVRTQKTAAPQTSAEVKDSDYSRYMPG